MKPTSAEIEQVYQFIWNYATEREALPSSRQIADALDMHQADVLRRVWCLRADERLCKTTFKPTAYDAWWRANVRAEHRWNTRPLWHPPATRRLHQLRLSMPDETPPVA